MTSCTHLEHEPCRRTRRLARLAVPVAVVALVVAGCGGSSSKSSSSSSSSSSNTQATTTPKGPPLTKAQYEQQLGPVLNDQVVPALRSALANGGARDPAKVSQAIDALTTAHDRMAAVNPPTEVADLHQQAVSALAAMITDATQLRDAETKHDTGGESAAANALKADAQKIQTVGSELTARGY